MVVPRVAAVERSVIQQLLDHSSLADAATELASSSSSVPSMAPKDTTSWASRQGRRSTIMKLTGREPAAGGWGARGHWAGAGSSPDPDRSASEACGTFLLGSKEAAEEERGRVSWASSSPWTMATWSLRVQRLISPQWGQSDPPSVGSAWVRPRQNTHNLWPSEDSIGSTQERQSWVILVWIRSSPEHSRGREGVSSAACRSRWVVLLIGFLLKEKILNGWRTSAALYRVGFPLIFRGLEHHWPVSLGWFNKASVVFEERAYPKAMQSYRIEGEYAKVSWSACSWKMCVLCKFWTVLLTNQRAVYLRSFANLCIVYL